MTHLLCQRCGHKVFLGCYESDPLAVQVTTSKGIYWLKCQHCYEQAYREKAKEKR